MFFKQSLLRRLVVLVFLPVMICLFWAYAYLHNSLPETSTVIDIQGSESKVAITRDTYGVPSIQANNDLDAFYAMGYLQAQDRLWQMELQRRLAQGRLSELFGRATLSRDISMRTIGLHRSAEASLKYFSKRDIAILEAYSAGVNAWLDESQQLPVEFQFFGLTPEPWTPKDSLISGKLLSLSLSYGANLERARNRAISSLTREKLLSIYPELASSSMKKTESQQYVSALDMLEQLEQDLFNEHGVGGQFAGSNAWVVSGEFTESGNPMLANDPHLAIQQPSLWYRAHIKGDTIDAVGMTIPGLPIIVFGHNQHIAWGGTNMPTDTQDLVIYDIDATKPYFQSGEAELEITTEKVNVSADFPKALRRVPSPATATIASTEHGPLLGYQAGNTQGYALKWTALEEQDTSIKALIDLNYAKDWSSFRQALSQMVSPTINFLYTDIEGNIGYSSAGKVPIRKAHSGLIPVPAEQFEWQGFIPWDEMPSEFNPARGYIINANHKHVSPDYPYFITTDWAPNYRADRIESLLSQSITSGKKFTYQDFLAIQTDTLDLGALKTMGVIKALYPDLESQIPMVWNWSGDYTSEPHKGAVFQVMLRHLKKRIFDTTQSGKLETLGMLSGDVTDERLLQALEDKAVWCNQASGCKQAIISAYNTAYKELTRNMGGDESDWSWAELAPRLLSHQPFSNLNILKPWFERSMPGVGSLDTVNATGITFDYNEGYRQVFGAGFRQIIEPVQASKFNVWYINSTGQSGNVMSQHYDDMSPLMSSHFLIDNQGIATGLKAEGAAQ